MDTVKAAVKETFQYLVEKVEKDLQDKIAALKEQQQKNEESDKNQDTSIKGLVDSDKEINDNIEDLEDSLSKLKNVEDK